MLPLLSEIVPVELVPLKVAPPILKAVARRITVCDREFSVERFTARHSIVITDVKTQQQVECADVLTTSESVGIEQTKLSFNGGEWLIPEWQLICETNISSSRTLITLREHADAASPSENRTQIAMFEFTAGSKLQKLGRPAEGPANPQTNRLANQPKAGDINLSSEQRRRHRHRSKQRSRSGYRH